MAERMTQVRYVFFVYFSDYPREAPLPGAGDLTKF